MVNCCININILINKQRLNAEVIHDVGIEFHLVHFLQDFCKISINR